jgi:hypothetical protein
MPRFSIAMLCLAAMTATAAGPQEGDPMSSSDCHAALDALQVHEDWAASTAQEDHQADAAQQREARAELENARRRAARACLGGSGEPPPPSRHLLPSTIVVPPVAAPPAHPPSLPATVAIPPMPVTLPPKRIEPPPIVTACDAAGCWASDGTRLQRVGPNLQGPRGVCTVQGAILHCP